MKKTQAEKAKKFVEELEAAQKFVRILASTNPEVLLQRLREYQDGKRSNLSLR